MSERSGLRLSASSTIVRLAPATLTMVLLAVFAVRLYASAIGAFAGQWGGDLTGYYLPGVERWLATGSPFLPEQLAGPYEHGPGVFLHPPVALYLFTPFLVLPMALWWLIPLALTMGTLWVWRPRAWAVTGMAAMLAISRMGPIIVGNTDIWILAFLAVGLYLGWPALLIFIKPSLGFLAFAGVRHRSWWYGLPVFALACLPFGALWFDWVTAVVNSPGDLGYSLLALPFMAIAVIGWLGRTR